MKAKLKGLATLSVLLGVALAGNFSGSLAINTRAIYSHRANSFTLEAAYAGSLLASEYWGDAYLETAFYPSWNLARNRFDPGLSKLELGYGNGRYAFGLGASPEPLSTLRLLRPFSLADDVGDYATGLWGGWAELYPNPANRLRLALRYQRGALFGVLHADGRLSGGDLQATFICDQETGSAALGGGFSTNLGETVVYSETWRLFAEPDPWRGGLGINFYLFGGLASIEAAYTGGGWQLAAAYSLQAGEFWSVDSLLLYEIRVNRLTGSLNLTYTGDPGDLTLGLTSTSDGYAGVIWLPALSARVYY